MEGNSENLEKLLESLGIKHGDPILKDVGEENVTESCTLSREADLLVCSDKDEDWYDSLNSEDIDILKDYGTTPPRTERNRKQKERNAYCSHAVVAAKICTNINKHKLASRCASLPLVTAIRTQDSSTVLASNINVYRQRKRSQDLQRSYERQYKFRMDEISNENCDDSTMMTFEDNDDCSKCESLPPVSLAIKVAPRSRYMSLSFKKIGQCSGLSDHKFLSSEFSADRIAFFNHISGLLKCNTQEQAVQIKARSEEEVLYQQELNEMVWLELQAWHAGLDTLTFDNLLIEQRQKVEVVYKEVMNFDFNKLLNQYDGKKEIRNLLNDHLPEHKLFFPELTPNFTIPLCTGCLSIWCDKCREKETYALEQVWQLLEKIDQVLLLFPSTRKLCQFFSSWQETEFVVRQKSLCLWFNTTSQLRFIISLLGRRLGHMTKESIPWPKFSDLRFDSKSPNHSTQSKDSGNHSEETVEVKSKKNTNLDDESKSLPTHSVKFEIEDIDEISPESSSDLNQSIESDLTSESSESLYRGTGRNDCYLSPPVYGLRRCSSDIFLEANPYRTYVGKLLRNKGMKNTLDKVTEVIRDVMMRTIVIIEESHVVVPAEKDLNGKSDSDPHHAIPIPLSALQEELRRHTKWTEKFAALGLPHFHSLFLFLASVPLHMMRECLKLRLEQMPSRPSRMSIKQLMREYKEGVKFAVVVRQRYLKWCRALLSDLPTVLANNLEIRKTHSIEELDSNVKKMLEVYLEWLDQFILMLHREPHVSGIQRNFLQDEWRFVRSTCPHVTDGESLAATRFCNIACHMLCSVRDFLDTGLDEMICDFQAAAIDNTLDDEDDDELFELGTAEDDREDLYFEEGEYNMRRRKLVQRCRALQDLISEARERALRAIALAKMLKKDLEVATELKEIHNVDKLFGVLNAMKHVLIKGHSLQNLLIFIPENLEKCPEEILSLLQLQLGSTTGVNDCDPFKYLILLSKPLQGNGVWKGQSVDLPFSAECVIALSRIQVNGIMLIVRDGCHLQMVRRKINEEMDGEFSFSKEQIAPHRAVTQSLLDMKNEALQLCQGLEKSICDMKEIVNISQFFSNADEDCQQLAHLTRDTIHQGFIFGFEYHKEVDRLVSGKQSNELGPFCINIGRHWMKFVKSHYSAGKGRRPRWALPGLEFLLLICDPRFTSQLSDIGFKTLRLEVEECREFIIGCSSNSESSAPTTPLLMGRPFRSSGASLSHQSSLNDSTPEVTDSPKFRNYAAVLKSNQPSIDEVDCSISESRMEKVRYQIQMLERSLEKQKIKDLIVGRVLDYHRELIEIKPHNVSFSWHRGFKIGAGRFAKVYTAVNNNSGELMAMKVLPLQPNDHRAVQKVASELKIFENVDHPHLVKYYGVEIHNDEMLMFMEYCDEGTLESLTATAEGLPEAIVRRYTRQLLSAVHALHENSIVHRDVKGANIFLAQEGNILKLGDFGCAVRLRGFQTEVGELSGIVGTHAYMAPEIFRSNEGHGRAADIWSIGCVVIEMVTGKRPWPQYDSSVQIMFQVGNGHSPPIPDNLQEEGYDFLQMCFLHDPKERADAAKLLDHTFVKVEDEDTTSMPLFSLMPFGPTKTPRSSFSDIKE